jgi:uncharacterized protein (TIGR02118 family)
MIKQIVFVARRGGLTPEAFQAYWRDSHGPLVRGSAPTGRYLRAYVQGMTALEAYQGDKPPAFDGTAELYFDSLADRDAFFADPAYLETIHPDEKRFADLERCRVLTCGPPQRICGPDPAEAAGVKLVIAVKRRPDLSVAAWQRHMREVHALLVRDHLTSQRYLHGYVQCFAGDAAYNEGEPVADATSELYFRDLDAMNAFLADPDYQGEVFRDGADYADMNRTAFFPVREEAVIPLEPGRIAAAS